MGMAFRNVKLCQPLRRLRRPRLRHSRLMKILSFTIKSKNLYTELGGHIWERCTCQEKNTMILSSLRLLYKQTFYEYQIDTSSHAVSQQSYLRRLLDMMMSGKDFAIKKTDLYDPWPGRAYPSLDETTTTCLFWFGSLYAVLVVSIQYVASAKCRATAPTAIPCPFACLSLS